MSNPFRREDGIALPTAIMVLTLCLLLTAVVAEGADRLSETSGTDTRAKRAFAAADAGIDVAIRRLRSRAKLPDASCMTNTNAGVAPTAGVCPPSPPERVGENATFSYVVSPATTAPGGCYQVPGATIPANYLRRCITSTGTVAGEVRRIQVQVVVPPRTAAQWMGILGLDEVIIRNSAQLSACWTDEVPGPMIGSNLVVSIDNSGTLNYGCAAKTWGVTMPSPQSPSIHWAAQPQGAIPVTTAPAPFTILPPPRTFASVLSGPNANGYVAADVAANATGTVSWNAATRSLALSNSATLRLTRGGDYTFCALSLGNGASLDVSTTEKTRIFIDSPNRAGSGCPSTPTGLRPDNGSRINWPVSVPDTDVATLQARALNLETYVYDSDVTFINSARYAGLMQAERSTVEYVNSSLTWGAVAAKRVILQNSGDFQRPVGLLGWGPDGPPWKSVGWTQCRSLAPPPATPHAGC